MYHYTRALYQRTLKRARSNDTLSAEDRWRICNDATVRYRVKRARMRPQFVFSVARVMKKANRPPLIFLQSMIRGWYVRRT